MLNMITACMIALVFVFGVHIADTTDGTLKVGDVTSKVLGQSGKITLTKGDMTITVEMDLLEEVKANGNMVKDNSHKFTTFANQDFTFEPLVDKKYQGTELDVKMLAFKATLTNDAVLTFNLYIFKSGGNITNGDEVTQIKEGNVKFDIAIQDWPFCSVNNTCQQNEIGEFLDIALVMKGSGESKKKNGTTETGLEEYDVGSGTIALSSKVYIDDNVQTLVAGYPHVEKKGSKTIYRFRCHKFASTMMYDPVIQLGQPDTGSGCAQPLLWTRGIHLVLAVSLVAIMNMHSQFF